MLGKGNATKTGRAARIGRLVLCHGSSASSDDYGDRDNRAERVGRPTDVGAERSLAWGQRSYMAKGREDTPLLAPSWSGWPLGTARIFGWVMVQQIAATMARLRRHSPPIHLYPANHEPLVHAS